MKMTTLLPIRQVLPAVVALILALPTSASAFKIDTHLWIGQQVLNDLEDDGSITVMVGERAVALRVPAPVREAVLAHRNEYLLGNIGPDAIPDLVVGQTLVHPGVANGWKTDDWLRFLLAKSRGSAVGTAFTYGYLGHAAADVFAHTYVNQYAGDVFSLEDETLVEQRHVALESFISRFNPPFLNAQGRSIGAPWQLVQTSDELALFVRDALIYDPEPARQHALGRYSKHLAAYRSYREVVRSAAELPLWREIDRAVLQAVASYYDINVSPEQAGVLIDLLNEEIIPRVQHHVDLTQEQVSRLNAALESLDSVHYEVLHGALREFARLHGRIASKLVERLDAEGRLCRTLSEQICNDVACCVVPLPFGRCALRDPVCSTVCSTVTRLQCPISEAAGRAAADLIRSLDTELHGTNGLFEQLLVAAQQVREQALIAKNSGLDLAQRLIDLGQVVGSNTSPIKALLENWGRDLDVALAAYVNAATRSMINTVDPASRALAQGSLTPMFEWWDCYHLTLIGVPAPVGTGRCGFRGDLEATWHALQSIADIVQDAALLAPSRIAGLPAPAAIRAQIEQLKRRASAALTDAAIASLIDLLPAETQDLIAVLEQEMSDERLRHYFTKSETGQAKGLLMIGDIAQRVRADMQLAPGDSSYDPRRYAVVYNAVVLAKLALLDQAGLMELAQQAGTPLAQSGASVFAGTDNVVAHAFASIDGNHPWMPVAPPRPASQAPYRAVSLPGYPHTTGYATSAGFVPWHPLARDTLFRGLFIGPLSPGVDAPSDLGLSALMASDYPYQQCSFRPFPDDLNDRSCLGGRVLPLLLQLLSDD